MTGLQEPDGITADPARRESSPSSRRRTCGFRFSLTDGLVLAAFASASFLMWPVSAELALALPVVLGHFFLFCNVFRITPRSECLWACAFILNAAGWVAFDCFEWWKVLAMQTPVTVFLLGAEIRNPSYHGILSRRLNRKNIDAWLRGDGD